MDVKAQENAFQRGMQVLERLNDPELTAAYKQYVARLESLLTPEELDAYVSVYQRERRQLTHQAAGLQVSPAEQSARDKVSADAEIGNLYQRFISLLGNRSLLDSRYE